MSPHVSTDTDVSILVDSRATHVINAPIHSVDLSQWIFSSTRSGLPGVLERTCRGR